MKIPPEAFAFPYRPACVLWVTGNDAATFLQGQFTNDLGSIVGGASVYGLWLDRKGRVIGDSWVTRAPDDSGFWIVSPSCGAEAISGHLGRHIIADEVDIYCATIKQRGAPILLEPTDEPYGLRDFVTRDPDGNVLTFSALLPTPSH